MRKNNVKIPGYKYSEDRLYNIWNSMIGRCYREKSDSYKHYGGRGIKVCEEWRNSFFAFKGWALSAGYDYNLSRKEQELDRINNDGDYCPENCRWISTSENNKNKRSLGRRKTRGNAKNSIVFSINGETKPLLDFCEEYGISAQLVTYRVKKKGMTPLEALTSSKMAQGRPKKGE